MSRTASEQTVAEDMYRYFNRALQAYAFLEQAVAEGAQIVLTRKTGSEVVKFL